MRILIVTALLLLALVVGGLLAVSHLVDLAAYRDQLTARAETLTGQSVAIRGDIDLDLLPRPTLSLAQATLSDPADAVRLEVDRLDLQLRPLPLLGGRLDVAAVRLVRPVLQVAPEARAQLLDLLGGATWLPLAPDGPRRLSVVDGRAILPGTGGQSSELEQVNLDVSTAGASTAVELGGTFALNRQPLRIDARLGRPNEDRSGTLRLELAAEGLGGAGASSLTFGGVVRWRADAPRVRGEVVLSGADARSTIGTIGDALGRPAMAMPAWLATPFRLGGRLDLADDRLEVTDLTVGLDDAALTGRLGVVLAAVPEFSLRLQTQRLDLAGASAQDLEAALGPLLALASAGRGEIVLAAGALEHREAALRRVRATLRLGGDGGVTISDARALLPGDTDVGFAGALAGTSAGMELRGTLTAVTRDLRATLAFLDLDPAAVPEDRLNVLSLASEVALRRDGLHLREIDLRLDSTRVTGSVALQPAPRPQIAANLALDRLDVDAYQPGRPPAEVLAGLAAPLRGVDAAIEAQIGRLTWGGVHLLDVAFGGRAVGERLRIDQLTVGDFADAEARVSGEVDLTDGAFDLTATLSDAHAPRVLRRFGVEPPPVLVRLDPLEVEASASGTLEAARIDVTVGAGSATLNLAGETGLSDGEPFYELEVAAGHPDYRALLQQLGARVPAADDPAGPLEVAGRVQREAGGESSVAGTARLGGTSFTGRIAWHGEERPYVDARISVGEPSA
ncbi:MAG TPA: AsmA family protein, partial [Kofleriaceae bacterium]|nr:AsmA family protein [Kofleriaceae bacterium]